MDPEEAYQIIFEPFDSDSQNPLNGVTLYIYEALGLGEVGDFVGKYTVDHGDALNIGPGEFFIDAYKPGYIQRFEMIDCRAINTPESRTATCSVPMVTYNDPIAPS